MKNHWVAAAFLCSALAVGCGGSGENVENPTPDTTVPAAEPAVPTEAAPPAASSIVDAAPARPAPARPSPAPATSTTAPRSTAKPATSSEPPRPQAPAPPQFREVAAKVGTELPLELTTALSTETAQVETPVTARLRQPVVVDGITVLPAGAVFHGNVTEVERAGRVRGRAHLVFRFTEVTIAGQRDPVRTNGLTFEGEATKSEDATKVGAGAGIGAVIGGIIGGGSGAAKGAAIGGAAGAGTVLATRGREVELPVGSEVTATLASPFEIQVEVR